MKPLQLNPQYRLQFEQAQDCHVLLFPEGMVQLNETASTILLALQEPKSLVDLIALLQERFPEAEALADDVREFVGIAREKQWLV
ncbi:pyrroloquinoline quinone biosynthesis protein D [Sinobacterium caligoides]|uniref:Pyrroloquinoline quinone biosynthesis protein D n=1 Tax=Sinobacterium caligoides TaxID=933926 RepID=A0A3N2DZ44_9GAMM|nr:pyrroloquinoline quinone biosynthesis peptide chaperone PqqD [Sinobacterium caligoides]ROS05037.1 pyrroloquinoline quinone biosynthesis protein D [Sinobacterium caligoides]